MILRPLSLSFPGPGPPALLLILRATQYPFYTLFYCLREPELVSVACNHMISSSKNGSEKPWHPIRNFIDFKIQIRKLGGISWLRSLSMEEAGLGLVSYYLDHYSWTSFTGPGLRLFCLYFLSLKLLHCQLFVTKPCLISFAQTFAFSLHFLFNSYHSPTPPTLPFDRPRQL